MTAAVEPRIIVLVPTPVKSTNRSSVLDRRSAAESHARNKPAVILGMRSWHGDTIGVPVIPNTNRGGGP
jgi:hypothetical protein